MQWTIVTRDGDKAADVDTESLEGWDQDYKNKTVFKTMILSSLLL